MSVDPIIDARGASELTGGTVAPATFLRWRSKGSRRGPQGWFRLGTRVVIHRSAVEAWIEASERGEEATDDKRLVVVSRSAAEVSA
jgi:hypothetical protein